MPPPQCRMLSRIVVHGHEGVTRSLPAGGETSYSTQNFGSKKVLSVRGTATKNKRRKFKKLEKV